MANIADNKFFISSEENLDEVYEQIHQLFLDHLEGDFDWVGDNGLEGWFESRWSFPFEYWDEILKDKPIYARFLTEEYGMGLVSMNIHDEDGTWREPQYFDI